MKTFTEAEKVLSKIVEHWRKDFVENYNEKYAGLDLDFCLVFCMKFGIEPEEFYLINEMSLDLNEPEKIHLQSKVIK